VLTARVADGGRRQVSTVLLVMWRWCEARGVAKRHISGLCGPSWEDGAGAGVALVALLMCPIVFEVLGTVLRPGTE
jgi:hypothetical protein